MRPTTGGSRLEDDRGFDDGELRCARWPLRSVEHRWNVRVSSIAISGDSAHTTARLCGSRGVPQSGMLR